MARRAFEDALVSVFKRAHKECHADTDCSRGCKQRSLVITKRADRQRRSIKRAHRPACKRVIPESLHIELTSDRSVRHLD